MASLDPVLVGCSSLDLLQDLGARGDPLRRRRRPGRPPGPEPGGGQPDFDRAALVRVDWPFSLTRRP
ncbi:hypothetical protein [Streptomyces sp. NPDC059460]|uniref:hypothetical protein n=1 Tax=Streptomyces sp. NPDC059460 TaxID=3346840 RepID=UPI00367A1F75